MHTRFHRLAAAFVLALTAAAVVRADDATELDQAFAKLRETTFKKRDVVPAMAMIPGMTPPVTEYAGGRSRVVSEVDVPMFGRMRTERVTVNGRSAVRTVAPGITAKLAEAKRTATAASARALLQQLSNLAGAAASGGVSSLQVVRAAIGGATAIKSAADARSALDRAAAAYGSWQLMPSEEEEFVELPPGELPEHVRAAGDVRVQKFTSRAANTVVFRRTATSPEMGEVVTVVTVNRETGLPVSEETLFNQQSVARSEYFDVGKPLTIEAPEALLSADAGAGRLATAE